MAADNARVVFSLATACVGSAAGLLTTPRQQRTVFPRLRTEYATLGNFFYAMRTYTNGSTLVSDVLLPSVMMLRLSSSSAPANAAEAEAMAEQAAAAEGNEKQD